jgi:hypothetical protein
VALLSDIIADRQYLSSLKNNFYNRSPVSADQFQKLTTISQSFSHIHQQYCQLDETFLCEIDHQLELLNQQHYHLHQQYLVDSENFFGKVLIESFDYILNTRRKIQNHTQQRINHKIQLRSSWIFPGLVFRPMAFSDLRPLVACDPLYLVDSDRELIDYSLKQFPPEYQRRLRPYVVDSSAKNFLHPLPQGNFGLVVALDFFNYKDFATMKKYLKEIFLLLRPGGICSFSFNDCDHSYETRMTEQHVYSYIPGSMLRPEIVNLGYNLIYHSRDLSGTSWWEIQKPGEISTIRGGQTLAKVIAKSK